MTIVDPLVAARNLDFAPVLEIEYSGGALPLDGASVSMEIRLYPGAAGDALIDVTAIPFQDVAAATIEEPDLRILSLSPVIDKAELVALPGINQPEAGSDQQFYQEIKITYADTKQDSLWIGDFILTPGVNSQ